MNFLKIVKAIVPVVIATAMPEAMINTALAGVTKHSKIVNNQTIPVLNMAVSTTASYVSKVMDTGDWVSSIIPALHDGGVVTGMSTALHQSVKIPLSEIGGSLAKTVGPGDKFSI